MSSKTPQTLSNSSNGHPKPFYLASGSWQKDLLILEKDLFPHSKVLASLLSLECTSVLLKDLANPFGQEQGTLEAHEWQKLNTSKVDSVILDPWIL